MSGKQEENNPLIPFLEMERKQGLKERELIPQLPLKELCCFRAKRVETTKAKLSCMHELSPGIDLLFPKRRGGKAPGKKGEKKKIKTKEKTVARRS